MSKSAQVPLHIWLPDAMEGSLILMKFQTAIIMLTISYLIIVSFTGNDFLFTAESCETSAICSMIPPILLTLNPQRLHIFTGCMLGDGSIARGHKIGNPAVNPGVNGWYAMTIAAAVYSYHRWLFDLAFAAFSTIGRALTPWPNPKSGLPTTQYHFTRLTSPIFTVLHEIWYRYDETLCRYIKIVPPFVGLMFSEISLAHWIMQDGTFSMEYKAIILSREMLYA